MDPNNKYPVIDLHCDLLSFLVDKPDNCPKDPISNCSILQLKDGGVTHQTLAIFTRSERGSSMQASKQVKAFQRLIEKRFAASFLKKEQALTRIIPAIENASGLLEEDEKLDVGIERLKKWQQEIGPILYISLTWNTENRFGGGNYTSVGLKEDGKRLLHEMAKLSIAIDMSHTSDALANDLIDYIEKNNLKIPILASHSNFRKIENHKRNLPDDIAKYIIQKKGLIGLNFIRAFVGSHHLAITDHITHALSLGAKDHLCLGADFFGGIVVEDFKDKLPFFFKELSNSSCYPKLLTHVEKEFGSAFVEKFSHKNSASFLKVPHK